MNEIEKVFPKCFIFPQEIHRSLDTGDVNLSRSTNTLNRDSSSNLVKGKSMPSLR